MRSQHWFRQWLGATRQQAIAWTNIAQILWRLVATLGYNEFKVWHKWYACRHIRAYTHHDIILSKYHNKFIPTCLRHNSILSMFLQLNVTPPIIHDIGKQMFLFHIGVKYTVKRFLGKAFVMCTTAHALIWNDTVYGIWSRFTCR